LIDGGIDVVHGHSSHHPLGIEIYRDKLILYGAGNFIDDYEGIEGYEEFRADLVLMYFASLELGSGRLAGLRIVPMQMRRFMLEHASRADALFVCTTLNRISRDFGTRFRSEDGTLTLAS
jgi:poly-gamma-glutamate capsule biosynthesis protein CapA/YwtB (metallophosphatase superfamily)